MRKGEFIIVVDGGAMVDRILELFIIVEKGGVLEKLYYYIKGIIALKYA